MNDILVEARGVSKVYRTPAEEIAAVDRVDLEIASGEFVSLMGPSGSGKTTLLDVIGCLTSITSGRLVVMGRDVSNAKERELVAMRRGGIGFVFQDFLLIPTLTALENVELPLSFARRPADRARAARLLEKVGLGRRLNHLPKELSGGERQRAAIARALVASPKLLLADEPTGNLDTKNSRDVYELFRALNAEDGLTIVVATHDAGLGSGAGRVVRLEDGRVCDDRGA